MIILPVIIATVVATADFVRAANGIIARLRSTVQGTVFVHSAILDKNKQTENHIIGRSGTKQWN